MHKVQRFRKNNWLPTHERLSQCSLCSVYEFFIRNWPNYFDEIYVLLEINGFQKLNFPHRKTNARQKSLSFIGPSLWNNLNKTLKTSTSLNAFKHDIKQHYFDELQKKES